MIDDALQTLERRAAESPGDSEVLRALNRVYKRLGFLDYPLPDCSRLQFQRRRHREVRFDSGLWAAMDRAAIFALTTDYGARRGTPDRKRVRAQRREHARRAAILERGLVGAISALSSHDIYAAASPSVAPCWGSWSTMVPIHAAEIHAEMQRFERAYPEAAEWRRAIRAAEWRERTPGASGLLFPIAPQPGTPHFPPAHEE